MKGRKKNKNVETFDVYPHLPQYQYNTGLPTAKKGGDFFSYDDYLTSTVLAQSGVEVDNVEEDIVNENTYKINGNRLKDGYADYGVPEWMRTSPLAAAFGFAGDVNNSIGNMKDGIANINPATGRPWSKLDYAKSTITNTTDENVIIDPEGLNKAFDWKGDIKEEYNNADNLFMTQNDAKSRYFNQGADYHASTFLNDDGTSVASKQTMDIDGNITYADVTEENANYNPLLPEGPDNLKTITRPHAESDLTPFDIAQDNVKDYGVNRMKTDGTGNVTTFSRTGPKEDEIYDVNKPYNDQTIIKKNNKQDDLNAVRYGGSHDLRKFTHSKYQEGGEESANPNNTGTHNSTDQPVDNECECPEGSENAGTTYFSSGGCGYNESMCGRMIDGTVPRGYEQNYPNGGSNGPQPVEVTESPNADYFKKQQEELGYLPWEDGYTAVNDAHINSSNPEEVIAANDQQRTDDAEQRYQDAQQPVDLTTPLGETTTEQTVNLDENGGLTGDDPVLDVDYGDGMQGIKNRLGAFGNTGVVGKVKNVAIEAASLGTKFADMVDVFAKDQKITNDNIINHQATDEAMDVMTTVESSRGDRGDFDVNTGDYRVSSLGYGDGPRGQIAQMGQEMGAPNPDYSYLQQFLNATVVGYEPEMLMMQAKDGGDIIDADMDLIKQLMAAGADFEMI